MTSQILAIAGLASIPFMVAIVLLTINSFIFSKGEGSSREEYDSANMSDKSQAIGGVTFVGLGTLALCLTVPPICSLYISMPNNIQSLSILLSLALGTTITIVAGSMMASIAAEEISENISSAEKETTAMPSTSAHDTKDNQHGSIHEWLSKIHTDNDLHNSPSTNSSKD